MKLSKLFALSVFACFVAPKAHSIELSQERSLESSRSASEIYSIITDYEDMCMSGCPRHLTGVVEIKVFGDVTSGKFHTWTHLKNTIDSTYFSEVVVTREGTSAFTISTSLPSPDQVEKLKAEHQLSHVVFASDQRSTWRVKEAVDSQGDFVKTKIDYSVKVVSTHPAVTAIAGALKKALYLYTDELFAMLSD